MKRIVLALFVSFCLFSCKTQLKQIVSMDDYYAPVDEVTIISSGQTLPDGLIRVGSISVGESGWTPTEECTYQACMEAIRVAAKKNGAHVVYIVTIKEPDRVWGSTCYDITADFFRYKK